MADFARSPDDDLFEACDRNDAAGAMRALDRGAGVHGSANDPPLHLCAIKGSVDAMRVLIERRAAIESQDINQNRALHHAAMSPDVRAVDLLLELRATVDPRNADGETPLYLAALKGRTPAVHELLESHASPATKTALGATPLMACADKGHVEAAQLLLAYNADPNAIDNFGLTALHWSSRSGHMELAQLLVDAGASMTGRDQRGRSIADIAKNAEVRAQVQKLFPQGAVRAPAAVAVQPAAAAPAAAAAAQPARGAPGAAWGGARPAGAVAVAGGGGAVGGGAGMRLTRGECERQLETALNTIEETQTRLAVEITRAEAAEQRAIDNESRANALVGELAELRARALAAETAMGEMRARAEQTEAALAACQVQVREQCIANEELRIRAERADHELTSYQVRTVELTRLVTESNQAVQQQQQQLHFMQTHLVQLQQHRDTVQQQLDASTVRCNQLTQFAKYANDRTTEVNTKLQQLQQQHQQLPHSGAQSCEAQTSEVDTEWRIPTDEVTLGGSIGKGSLAEVKAAKWLGIDIAAKCLFFMNEETIESLGGLLPADRAAVMQSFYRECRINSQLRHPNIVMFLGVGIDRATNEGRFLLLERMHRSLHDMIYEKPGAVLPLPVLVDILSDVCSALVYLHSRSPPVLHFDIKPKNVLMDRLNRAKLADLGEAQVVFKTAALAALTRSGILTPFGVGTELYRSPEMAFEDQIKSSKSDMFMLGVLVAEVGSGAIPSPAAALISEGQSCMQFRAIPEQDRRAADIQKIRYPELQLLARNLILHNPAERWSANNVLAYLTQLRETSIRTPSPSTITTSFS